MTTSIRTRTRRTIITASLVTLSLAVLGAFVALEVRDQPEVQEATGREDPRIVRDDSHVLQEAPDGSPVLVEFLDFSAKPAAPSTPRSSSLGRTSPARSSSWSVTCRSPDT